MAIMLTYDVEVWHLGKTLADSADDTGVALSALCQEVSTQDAGDFLAFCEGVAYQLKKNLDPVADRTARQVLQTVLGHLPVRR